DVCWAYRGGYRPLPNAQAATLAKWIERDRPGSAIPQPYELRRKARGHADDSVERRSLPTLKTSRGSRGTAGAPRLPRHAPLPPDLCDSTQVDPDGLRLGVVGHRLQALVAAEAGLFVAAPGLGHVAVVEAVDPDDA